MSKKLTEQQKAENKKAKEQARKANAVIPGAKKEFTTNEKEFGVHEKVNKEFYAQVIEPETEPTVGNPTPKKSLYHQHCEKHGITPKYKI